MVARTWCWILAVALAAGCGDRPSYILVEMQSQLPLSVEAFEIHAANAGDRNVVHVDKAFTIPPRQSVSLEFGPTRGGEVEIDIRALAGGTEIARGVTRATIVPKGVAYATVTFGGGGADLGGPADAGAPPDLGPVVPLQLVTGSAHTCARMSDGTVRCFGDNSYQQLGLGEGSAAPSVDVPTTVPGLTSVRQIAAGDRYTCVVAEGGLVKCWGDNSTGQLGSNDGAMRHGTPQTVPQLVGVNLVACGSGHTCAIVDKGQVRCWGQNAVAQTGRPKTDSPVTQPTAAVQWTDGKGSLAAPLGSVAELALGNSHSCARLVDGTVYCWGADSGGLLGRGSETGLPRPVAERVALQSPAVDVSASGDGSCVVLKDGTGACWGYEAYGAFGTGLPAVGGGGASGKTLPTPTPICSSAGSPCGAPQQGLTRVALGAVHHSCAIIMDDVRCFGEGRLLGDGTTKRSPVPATIAVRGAVDLAVSRGGNFSCAILGDSTAWCWGLESGGDFGDATGDGWKESPSPVFW